MKEWPHQVEFSLFIFHVTCDFCSTWCDILAKNETFNFKALFSIRIFFVIFFNWTNNLSVFFGNRFNFVWYLELIQRRRILYLFGRDRIELIIRRHMTWNSWWHCRTSIKCSAVWCAMQCRSIAHSALMRRIIYEWTQWVWKPFWLTTFDEIQTDSLDYQHRLPFCICCNVCVWWITEREHRTAMFILSWLNYWTEPLSVFVC